MTTELSQVITDIAAGPFGSNLKVECFVPSGFPIIDGANLKGFKVTDNITKFVTEEKAQSLHRSIAHRGDVVVTISGTIGQIAYIPEDSEYEAYLVSQRQFRVTFDDTQVFVPYLVYYFHTAQGQHQILSFANQTGVPALSQPLKNFKKITIDLPPLEEQRRIAGILGSLDDKIELNRRINANLEAQAQALFRSWFVDNDNQLGNYQTKSLTDIAQYLNGLAMQKFPSESIQNSLPVLKIKELGQGLCDASSDRCSTSIKPEYIINDGDVIFSWSGTLLVDVWCGGKCGLNQHLFKVTSDNYPKWFIFYWTKHHLDKFIRIAKDKAVTMGHIKRCDLESSEVKVPEKSILEYLDKIFTPLFDSMITHRIENRKLSALRDTLLPKLMAGEIKI